MNMQRGHTERVPRPAKGLKTAYYLCKARGCGRVYYRDYQPYSLSNPIISSPCGHSVGAHDYNLKRISRAEFYAARKAGK